MAGEGGRVEARLCEDCGKIHIGDQCGTDLLEEDNFTLEFEQLPPDEHIQQLRKAIQQARDERWRATSQAQKYRRKLVDMGTILPHVKEELSRQKFSVSKLKAHAAQQQRLFQDEFRSVSTLIRETIDRLSVSLTCDGSCVYIKEDFKKLQAAHEKLKTAERELVARIAALEAKLALKTKEADTLSLHSKNKDQNIDQKLSKLQKDLLQKEQELKVVKKDYLVSQRHLEEEAGKLTEAQKKSSKIASECERLKQLLKHAQDESQTLMQQRDEDLEQIENLKKEIEAKNKEMVKIKSGVKDDVDAEMLKMMKDMDEYQATIEKRVQEASEKEKDRIKRELEQYVTDYRSHESKLMAKMRTQGEKHRDAQAQLQRQLEDARANAAAREHDLQVQIKQLQNHMAARTDSRASKAQTPLVANTPLPDLLLEKDTQIRTLGNELQFFKDKVEDLTSYIDRLKAEGPVDQKVPHEGVDSKVEMMEQLVQREVEERNQLLKAFNRARDQLALCAKLHGGLGGEGADTASLLESWHPGSDDQQSGKTKDPSALESLTIYKKRTENKYGAFKPPESQAMDLAELQNGFGKSLPPDEYRSTYARSEFAAKSAKSTKSGRTEKTEKSGVRAIQRLKTDKSARSMKSLKSLTSYYSMSESQGTGAVKGSSMGGDTTKCLYDDDSDSEPYSAERNGEVVNKLSNYPPKPIPPDNTKKPKSLDPRPQMPFQSPLGRDKLKKPDGILTDKRRGKSTERSKDEMKPDALAEALGRIASGSDPERVPRWAQSQGGGGKLLPLPRALQQHGDVADDSQLPPAARRKQRTSWAPQVEILTSKSESPNPYLSAREPRNTTLPRGSPGKMAQSDGFLETTRSNPARAGGAGPGGVAVGARGGGTTGRLSMMKSVNQTAGKQQLTNESSWKIYQQLKVGKQ